MTNKEKCIQLRNKGWSIRLISDEVGLSPTAVRHHVKHISVKTKVKKQWTWSEKRYQNLNLKRADLDFDSPIKYSENLAYLIGLYLGDGYYSCGKFGLVCGTTHHPQLIEKWKSAFIKVFNIEPKIRKRKNTNCIDIYLYDKKNNPSIGYLLNIKSGKKTQTAKVPKWIFTKEVYIKKCLLGLMESDGGIYHTYKKGGWYWYAALSSKSKFLIKDVLLMCEKLKIKAKQESETKIRVGTKDTKKLIKLIKIDKMIEYVYD